MALKHYAASANGDVYDNAIITNLYEKERAGWRGYSSGHGNLLWTLVPRCMINYIDCMEISKDTIGEALHHVFKRDDPTAIAGRAGYTPPATATSSMAGLGSPKSYKRRRV